MYSAYKLNRQGDNIQPQCIPFPIWNQSVVPCLVLTFFLTCIQISQEAGKVVCYSQLFKNSPQFVVIHTVKGFSVVNKEEVDVSLELPSFSMIQKMLAIWSVSDCLPLPLQNPTCTSGSSLLTYCWSLTWRILCITSVACKIVWKSEHCLSLGLEWNCMEVWHCLSLGLEWKLTFSNPVATAEISKFTDILSATL